MATTILTEDVCLADEVAEGGGTQPLCERGDVVCVPVGRIGKEVAHDVSMLRRVSGSAADLWSGASYERIAETFAPIHDRIVEELAADCLDDRHHAFLLGADNHCLRYGRGSEVSN